MIPEKAKEKIKKSRVVFTCAHCLKFWWGVENGVEGCKAVHEKKPCGGPISGMAYPEYEGPLKGYLDRYCFVCGKKSEMVAQADSGGLVGVCSDHVHVLNEYSKPGEKPPFVTHKKVPVLE